MKKIVYSLLIVLGVLVVTGCGKEIDFSKTNHIVCTKVEDKGSEITTTTLTFAYDNKENISNFKAESDIAYKNTMSKEASEIAIKTMELISKTLGLSFKSDVEENRMYYSFSGNIKVFKVLMKKLDASYEDEKVTGDTKQEALEELTKDGYSCEDIKK